MGFKLTTLLVFNPFNKLFKIKDPKWPTWESLIDYARWCPNIHNLQPHRIKIISETEAYLYYDPARLLPIGDPRCVFVTVAMGIFIEHLSIAAAVHRVKVELVEVYKPITTQATSYTRFARLKLVESSEKEELNSALILERRTSRSQYDGLPLKEAVLSKLKSQSQKFDHDFFYSNDKEMIDFTVKLNQQTLFEDLSSTSNRKELDHLFRYTKQEAATRRDGLWARCMGFPGLLMKSVFRHPERWSEGIKKTMLTDYYRASFKGTATVCWLSGHFDNTNDWLRAGQMLARNWLLITKEKAYIQPFGSLITNASAYEQITKKLNQTKEQKKIWMIFRAGYSKEPARSFRLNTNEIIIR
ncbi:hypothetical protein [Pedobacter frigidisoli]|nr:hypothetical protein [Pedobacter frigidisoli]